MKIMSITDITQFVSNCVKLKGCSNTASDNNEESYNSLIKDKACKELEDLCIALFEDRNWEDLTVDESEIVKLLILQNKVIIDNSFITRRKPDAG